MLIYESMNVNGEKVEIVIKDDPATEENEALLEAGKNYKFDIVIASDGAYAVRVEAQEEI